MYILAHFRIRSFQYYIFAELIACGDAGLHGEVVFLLHLESREVQAQIHTQATAQIEVIFKIGRCFVGKDLTVGGSIIRRVPLDGFSGLSNIFEVETSGRKLWCRYCTPNLT